ncbi:MAG: hypothetical protein A2Y55_10965 [Actinobacteria bacterium RBG_16_68_12]|nr:MAG: hypothetical protein A2Y55_10965 [Actinobacteria bacterium RBG_16_68_12]
MIASLFMAGCDSNDSGAPLTLMTGARAPEPATNLEGVEGRAAMTSVTTGRTDAIEPGTMIAECVERAGSDTLSGPIVIRLGVSGESVTFRDETRHGLHGCDNSLGPREARQRACGVAFGQLLAGRLRDPRLNVGGCSTRDGEPLGFAWVEPDTGTRFVAVEQDGYVEVYETAAGLPIRVTTGDVDIERSSAEFRISEHGSDGHLIRRYRLEASVAG